MKTIIVFILMLVLALGAKAQSYVREGKQFVAVNAANNSSTGELKDTGFTYKDSKGKVYPIYISNSGSCFIIKTSAKTGKDYKSYMKPKLSEEICKELGVEYKSTRKK